MIKITDNDLLFAKVRDNAIIPTKEEENAGRDVYSCFDEDYIVIPSHTTKLISTGIASAMSSKWEIRLRDRGSNGSKGIHVNAGTIDSGFRGEWFVAWCNTNSNDVILSKLTFDEIISKYGRYDDDNYLFIPIDLTKPFNDVNSLLIFTEEDYQPIIYIYTKAIAQAELCEVPVVNEYTVSYKDLLEIPSKRGTGMIGSSNK